MAIAAQVAANQQNGWRSIGPKTEAGKEICSRNAVTHGLTSKKLLLSVEEQSEFDQLRKGMLEAMKPATDYERILFDDTVRAHWMWTRAQAVHNAFLDTIVREERKADPKLTTEQALARIFTEEKNAKRLRLLLRYQSAAERTYRKSKQELDRVIAARVRVEANSQPREVVTPPLPTVEIGSVSKTVPPAVVPASPGLIPVSGALPY